MEEFHNIYKLLSEITIGIRSWGDEETLKTLHSMIQGIEPLIKEKCAPILIKTWINQLYSTDIPTFKPSLKNVMTGIFEVEKILADGYGNTNTDEDVPRHIDTIDTDDKSVDMRKYNSLTEIFGEVIATEGSVYIREKLLEKLKQSVKSPFRTCDVAWMIKSLYKKAGVKIKTSTSTTYARGYINHLEKKEKKIPPDNKDTKKEEPKEKISEEPELDKVCLFPFTPMDKKENKNIFEKFQDDILDKAKQLGWKEVRIEKIASEFPEKTMNQVEMAVGILLTTNENILQFPPKPKDIEIAEEQKKPKPKGYILFQGI